MNDASSTAQIDVPRLRAALCKARQTTGGDLLLFVVWLALETTNSWLRGSHVLASAFGAFGALMLVMAVAATVVGNRTDDAKAAGPTDVFVAHCRSVLTPLAGTPGAMKSPVFFAVWGLAGTVFLVVDVFDVVGETPPQYLRAAAHVMFAVALFLRPLWNWRRRAPEFARELATLPPPPPPSADLVGRTRELLAAGQKIQAIKQWREATGASLLDAKRAVENLERPKLE